GVPPERQCRRGQRVLDARVTPPGRVGAGDGRVRELAHLFHGAEDGRLIDFGPAFTFESTYTFAVLPERHRRSVEHPIGDLHVRLALGIEHEDTADIARVTPDD